MSTTSRRARVGLLGTFVGVVCCAIWSGNAQHNEVGAAAQASASDYEILAIGGSGGTNRGGTLVAVSSLTGQRRMISDFGVGSPRLVSPWGVAIGAEGSMYVSDWKGGTVGPYGFGSALYSVDQAGGRTLLSDFGSPSGGPIGTGIWELLVEASGSVLAVDAFYKRSFPYGGALFRFDPNTRTRSLLSDFTDASQGFLGSNPEGIAVDADGTIFVIDTSAGTVCRPADRDDGCGALIRVDPVTGRRTVVSDFGDATQGPFGLSPTGVAIDIDGSFLVVDGVEGPACASSGRFDCGVLFSVDRQSGQRRILTDLGDASQGASGTFFPYDVAVGPDGAIFITPCGGGICRVDRQTGFRERFSDFGDPGLGPVSDEPRRLSIRPRSSTTTSLEVAPNPAAFGQRVRLTATVTGASPTGQVEFFDGGSRLGSDGLVNGIASFFTSDLPLGTHSITANYPGDALNPSSMSSPVSVVINDAATSMQLLSSANPAFVGQPVAFTAALTSAGGGRAPTGTVQFEDNGVPLGTSPINAGGSATVTTSALTLGAHQITASYPGGGGFLASSASIVQRVTQPVDLEIVKTVSSATGTIGQPLTYSLQVRNNGPADGTGVVARDMLPASVTVDSVSAGCTQTGLLITCPIGNLAAAAAVTLTVVATPTAAGAFVNSAEVRGNEADPDSRNDTSSATTAVDGADLSVTMAPPVVDIMGTIVGYSYLVITRNNGPDPIPAGVGRFHFQVAGAAAFGLGGNKAFWSCSNNPSPGTDQWDCVTSSPLPPGAVDSLQFVELPAVVTLAATATIGAPGIFDPNTANNSVSVTTTRAADLSVVKTVSSTAGTVGQPLTYAIRVTNNGPADAVRVVVNDTVPANLSLTSVPAGCTVAGAQLFCPIGDLAVNATRTLTLTGTPTAPGTFVNTARVSALEPPDPLPGNDQSSVTTIVDAVDLAVTLGDAPDPVGVGGTLTYTIGVANIGSSTATNVALTFVRDPSLSLISFGGTGLTGLACSGQTTVTCNVASLPNGAQGTIILRFATSALGTLAATASIASPHPETNSANNIATTTTTVLRATDLAIAIADAPDPAPVNGPVIYTIDVTNNGPVTDAAVNVTGTLTGAAVLEVSAPPTLPGGSACTMTPTTFSCQGGKLVTGQTAALIVRALPAAPGTVTLTASISGEELESNPSNNIATATTTIFVPPPPELTLAPIYTQGASYRIAPPVQVLSPIYTQGASYRIAPPALTLAPIYTAGASYQIQNTPPGPTVTVLLSGGVRVVFSNVTAPGMTSLVPLAVPPVLPPGYVVVDGLAFDVSTTAAVSGLVTVSFEVPFASDPQVFSSLRVLHGETAGLVDRTVLDPNDPMAPDFATRTISARVSSLSPFVIARRVNRPPVSLTKNIVVTAGSSCMTLVRARDVDGGSFDPDAGDSFSLSLNPAGPFGPGIHNVLLTATDNHGASSSAPATITVRDVTRPTPVCPMNVVVDFADAAGAVVDFASQAADNCSVASIVSSPAAGSRFAIGSTAVTSTATDPSGNAASCGFQVTVLGTLGVKRDVIADLKALRAKHTDDSLRDSLQRAVEFLQSSVDADFWIDQTHVKRSAGERVFALERKAVAELREASSRHQAPHTLADLIQRIVRADRLLASVAIDDAVAAHGDSREIAKARERLTEGDRDVALGRPEQGIEDYAEAWMHAQNAMGPRRSTKGEKP